MAKTIVGSFDSFEEAQEVFRDLQQSGFSQDDVSIIGNNASGKVQSTAGDLPPDAPGTLSDTGSGAATGAAAGGVLGGAAGLVVGLMGLAIPGIGPIVAAGPLAAALAGAGVGAVAGGLIGGLTGAGVSEDDANYYAESVRRGGALVTVRAEDSRADEAVRIMRSHGAVDVERRAAQWRDEGWTRHDPAAEPYSVDQMERDRAVYRGSPGVTAGENVSTATQSRGSTVGLPATGSSGMAQSGMEQRGMEQSGMGQSGMGGMAGMGLAGSSTSGSGMQDVSARSWDDHRDYFRMHHAETVGKTTGYDEYEPAYRYGWDSGSSGRYRGRSWTEIEPELRNDWERRYPEGGAWERFKSAVRRGWDRTSDAVESAMPGDSDRDGR
ncbi:MAG: hypothetical protein ACXWVT_07840 [Burkholderiaceae bacterium]